MASHGNVIHGYRSRPEGVLDSDRLQLCVAVRDLAVSEVNVNHKSFIKQGYTMIHAIGSKEKDKRMSNLPAYQPSIVMPPIIPLKSQPNANYYQERKSRGSSEMKHTKGLLQYSEGRTTEAWAKAAPLVTLPSQLSNSHPKISLQLPSLHKTLHNSANGPTNDMQ